MKKSIVVIFIILSSFNSSFSQKWVDILNSVVEGVESSRMGCKQVCYKTVVVNSPTKWNGDTRKVVSFQLPNNSEGFYYRITPMYVNYTYNYPKDETLYMNIINKNRNPATPRFGEYAIVDVFLMNNSADAYNFDKKEAFTSFASFKRIYTAYLIENTSPSTVYIGIRNPNVTKGLRVIVEVVAYGHYNY